LDWLTKLAGQILAAGLVAWQGVQIVSIPIGGLTLFSPTLSLVLTVLAIVLVMNAVNFIDGLDGLVAGVTLIASGVFFIYSFLLATSEADTPYFNYASLFTAILLGGMLGFVPLNWHPAKLFLGDSGSLLVGLIMATTAISVTGQIDPATVSASQLLPAFIPMLLPLAVLIVPLLDFLLAVLRRLRAGMSPFEADRQHLHHRLLDMGHTHLQAVLILYAWTAVLAVGTLLFLFVEWYFAVGIIAIGLLGSTVITLSPDNLVEDDPLAIDAPQRTV
jgi:UDP-GlcNAc:undecaprenyl-phosphate GlcNAc-1-phosphate transferase